MKKIAVLFSGGLDSRLVLKLTESSGFIPIAVYLELPFAKKNSDEIKKFCKKEKVKLKVIDCTKGKNFKNYLKIIKNPDHQRGKGYNPCIDCKIFMYRKIKEFADKKNIKYISTGEVLGQRPLSQSKNSLKKIEKDSDTEGRILRPLIKIGINGRKRDRQINLARKYKINYPNPSGGCLLCEKNLKKRFKILIEKDFINYKNLSLVSIGRHFIISSSWFVVGRNEIENKEIEKFRNSIKSNKGKPAVYYQDKSFQKKAEEIQKDFSKGGNRKLSKESL